MPTYTFVNDETGDTITDFMKYSEAQQFLEQHPGYKILPCAPLISYNDIKKPDNGFRDRLKEIKKSHHGSNINTF